DELADQQREAQIAEIAKLYPLPDLQTMRLKYRRTNNSRIWVHKFKDEIWIPVTSSFGVPARLRYFDQGDAYGLRCLVEDMEGRPRAVDFDRAGLAKMGAADIRSMLFAAGLRTEADGETIAVQCLKAADPVLEILVVRRPGWHEVPGCADPIFVAPSGAVFG